MILKNSKYFVATLETLKPLTTLALSLSLLYLLYFSPVFRVQRLQCVQDVGEPCQNEFVLAELNALANQNLFLVDSSQFQQRALAGDATISRLRLVKQLPETLTLVIESVSPVLALSPAGSDRLLLLDDQFRVIKAVTTDPNLPYAIYNAPLSLRQGQTITEPSLRTLLSSVLTLTHAFPPSRRVILRDNLLILTLPDSRHALFTTTKSLDLQIAALRSLLQNATIPPATLEIDVRYSQPVLRSQSSL